MLTCLLCGSRVRANFPLQSSLTTINYHDCNKNKNALYPELRVNGKLMERISKFDYLGDIFNEKGNNIDLLEDRIKKGNACLVNAISMCSDLMGVKAIQTVVLSYKTTSIPTLLYNCQSWTNLTKGEINK